MHQSKQNNLSTYQSRRNLNTETQSSRFREQFKYDINDYLPPDEPIKNTYHFYSFARQDDDTIAQPRPRTKTLGSVEEANYSSFDSFANERTDKLIVQIQKLTVQHAKKQKTYEQRIEELEKNISTLSSNYKKIESESVAHLEKISEMSETLKLLSKEKTQAVDELNWLKKKNEKKNSNIRIFCQKYQVTLEPKIKQSYSIEVQTERELKQDLKVLQPQQIPKIVMGNPSQEMRSNRKISCTGKPQFYQLYQQQNDQQLDLNNQMTSRSQVILSGLKPKKPAFIQNVSQFTDKQNDRRKANQKIEERITGNFSQVSKNKIKVKNQQVQIYPIDESQIQDIISAILAQ